MDIEIYLYACDECRHKAKKGEEYPCCECYESNKYEQIEGEEEE